MRGLREESGDEQRERASERERERERESERASEREREASPRDNPRLVRLLAKNNFFILRRKLLWGFRRLTIVIVILRK